MESYKKLLRNNEIWAAKMEQKDPEFFSRLAVAQKPEVLWIGCSDSRVPESEITGTLPGEIFVHRNIANMVVHTDLNLLSVLDYAVSVLKVRHVIVCGHYGCGGIQAAMTNQSFGLINKWLRNIKDVYRMHRDEIDGIPDLKARFARMVEINVQEQVHDLSKTSIVQRAWKQRGVPHLHGWVYKMQEGLIQPLIEIEAGAKLDDIYRFDNLD